MKDQRARGFHDKRWKGFGQISGHAWAQIKKGAVYRNLECTVTLEDIWNQFLKQKGACALSGVPLVMWFEGMLTDSRYKTASLDRIDSSKGYVPGNIQWVHKDVNRMKMALKQERFINWCRRISNYMSNTKLINKSAVKAFTLASLKANRPHLADKMTRVSKEIYEEANRVVEAFVAEKIMSLPSVGKTIK